jgi:multiple sugar transport system substrate-binding protein
MNWFKDSAKRFEESHPGIKVEIITSAGSNYFTKLTTLWATGMPPDIWGQAGTGRGWQKQGWLLDLTPYVQEDLAELDVKDFLPFAWQSAQWDGKVWGLPAISTASPLFYNADMFEERGVVVPPHVWSDKAWTWQDMVAAARKLTVTNPDGRLRQAGVGIDDNPIGYITFSYTWGADWFDEDAYRTGKVSKVLIDSDKNKRAWREVRALAWEDHVAPRPTDGFDAWGGFQGGKVAMHLGASPWIVMGKRNVLQFRWGMAAQPMGEARASIVYTDLWFVGAKSKHPREAWEFVKYLSSSAVQKSYATIADLPPARISALGPYMQRLAGFSRFQSAQDMFLVFMGGQQYGRLLWQSIIDSADKLAGLIHPRLQDILANRTSVEEGLVKAAEAVRAYLKVN